MAADKLPTAIGVTAIGSPGAPAISAPGWPDWTAIGGGGGTRFASGLGSSFMVPAGPPSMTPSGEMLSSRQPFSVSPSDNTRELVPDTAKIAMRRSGPITTPVSLTSRNGELASSAADAVSGRRCVGLNSGSASFRISGAAGSVFAGGKRASGEGRWLVMERIRLRIRPAQTTHPARIKGGQADHLLEHDQVCARAKLRRCHATEAMFQKTKQLATKALRYS